MSVFLPQGPWGVQSFKIMLVKSLLESSLVNFVHSVNFIHSVNFVNFASSVNMVNFVSFVNLANSPVFRIDGVMFLIYLFFTFVFRMNNPIWKWIVCRGIFSMFVLYVIFHICQVSKCLSATTITAHINSYWHFLWLSWEKN